jgi:hypothetical protein
MKLRQMATHFLPSISTLEKFRRGCFLKQPNNLEKLKNP